MENTQPWQQQPLHVWSICGMNHYHVDGERFLFVSMVRNGMCITEEGKDDEYLWNRLCHKAWNAAAKELKDNPLTHPLAGLSGRCGITEY